MDAYRVEQLPRSKGRKHPHYDFIPLGFNLNLVKESRSNHVYAVFEFLTRSQDTHGYASESIPQVHNIVYCWIESRPPLSTHCHATKIVKNLSLDSDLECITANFGREGEERVSSLILMGVFEPNSNENPNVFP